MTLNDDFGKNNIHQGLDAGADKAKSAVDSTVSTLHRATDKASDIAAATKDRARSATQQLTDQVQRTPLAAVAVALAVGWLGAKLFSSRTRIGDRG